MIYNQEQEIYQPCFINSAFIIQLIYNTFIIQLGKKKKNFFFL